MAVPTDFDDLGLSITGLASQYPPYALTTEGLEKIGNRYYPDSPFMKKILALNAKTGIITRPSVNRPDDPLINQDEPPSIADLHQKFMDEGVPLAIKAAQKAITEAQISVTSITHMVSTTCTDSANPGYDHFVAKGLGIQHPIEKVLLHGIACSGGLAALRTAANLALGHARRGKPARVLVVALEINTSMVRSEMESMSKLEEVRIGLILFSDCAGALVLSNGIRDSSRSIYGLLGWEHRLIPGSEKDLGFDVDPLGWKVVMSPRIPAHTTSALLPMFSDLLDSIPPLPKEYTSASGFDWAIHPGGARILSGAQEVLGVTRREMRASYDTYANYGNSSSATIFTVLDRLRRKNMEVLDFDEKAKEYAVACAFGPGITVEMCMLKRCDGGGTEMLGGQQITAQVG